MTIISFTPYCVGCCYLFLSFTTRSQRKFIAFGMARRCDVLKLDVKGAKRCGGIGVNLCPFQLLYPGSQVCLIWECWSLLKMLLSTGTPMRTKTQTWWTTTRFLVVKHKDFWGYIMFLVRRVGASFRCLLSSLQYPLLGEVLAGSSRKQQCCIHGIQEVERYCTKLLTRNRDNKKGMRREVTTPLSSFGLHRRT